MAYIFLDESGDLGFKKTSSKWFLFTMAITSDPKVLERVIKKVWRTLKKKNKKLGELHAYHEKDITRKRVLRMLSQVTDLKVFSIILNKQKVHVNFQDQKNYLYVYMANLLLENLHNNKKILKDNEPIHLFVDQKDTKKQLRDNFIHLLTSSISKKRIGKFSVVLHSSHENKSLQAVDFISWAIFRKYEREDYEFYELIKSKVIEEKLFFP